MKRLVILGLLLPLLGLTMLQAAGTISKRGTTAAPFLEINVGPRAIAMGGASTATVSDATALFWNPAAIDRFAGNEVNFAYSQWIASMNFMYGAAVLHAGEVGSFGIAVTSLATPEMEVRTTDYPEGLGTRFDAADMAIGVGYSKRLTDRFAFGATFKYINRRIWHMTASALAADFGILYTLPWDRVTLGMSVTNFGSKLQMNGVDADILADIDPTTQGNTTSVLAQLRTKEWALPFTLRFGIGYELVRAEQNSITVTGDYKHPNSDNESLNGGIEYSFNHLLFLRAGYQNLFVHDSEEGLTLGAGLEYGQIAIDYAYMGMRHLGYVQQFGARLRF